MSKTKPVFLVDSPYADPEWPTSTADDQRDILECLTRLLTPVAEYRSALPQNPGKRRRREQQRRQQNEPQAEPAPTPPEISSYITIGINATTSALEACCAAAAPLLDSTSKRPRVGTESVGGPPSAVFVCTSDGQPTEVHQHLPTLCHLASQATGTPVKLVMLPKGADARLASAMGLPRVGVFGLRAGVKSSETLLSLVANIPNVRIPWLDAQEAFKSTNIKVVMTSAPPPVKKGEKKVAAGKAPPSKKQRVANAGGMENKAGKEA